MTEWLDHFASILFATARDILPILLIILVFQLFIIRKPIPHFKKTMIGFVFVLVGIACFLEGLERALFPLGELMAQQLTHTEFISPHNTSSETLWYAYGWVYLFAASIGFATTLAEPSLMAVAIKAEAISGGTIHALGLRLAVALGVAFGITLGSYRIITGTELYLYILVGYCIVIIQTFFAPKSLIGLAYDSGGVTTSSVTVPLVTALGLGLASSIPGRSPLLDGFGLIAFASLFPIMTVLAYAQISHWLNRRKSSY
ncbi:MAG TPA: DUF1538 domain-containing protein [Methylococcaceae bacterium]|nr:DUF1538 domain-containing protein [Methylococcaceae bacterium]HIN68104.1 DUF1538 domain-containing protein [Methylococcales bacterium]HIA45491.1 DUF1538 domain-containing protein [Methylococcaceae bacterium]HIB63079.1 DUF1538 domain-containing protein [Methylococcaceae bacterium]HIO12297.1 DUF1538 domain-containing protein [Methylococcales bacterium]